MEFKPESEDFEADTAPRPGLLIRRLHQIHLALFAEECAGFEFTPVQYAILDAIALHAGMDPSRISEEAGLDRTLFAKTVVRLEAAGLLKRITSRLDRRQKLLSLTPRGRAILEGMREPVARAHARTIAALSLPDREVFLALLATLVEAANPYARAKPRLK